MPRVPMKMRPMPIFGQLGLPYIEKRPSHQCTPPRALPHCATCNASIAVYASILMYVMMFIVNTQPRRSRCLSAKSHPNYAATIIYRHTPIFTPTAHTSRPAIIDISRLQEERATNRRAPERLLASPRNRQQMSHDIDPIIWYATATFSPTTPSEDRHFRAASEAPSSGRARREFRLIAER